MARKSVATPEGVIRYFLTGANFAEVEATYKTVKTILETRGVLAGRKATKAKTTAEMIKALSAAQAVHPE